MRKATLLILATFITLLFYCLCAYALVPRRNVNAPTATALAANGTNCGVAGQFSTGVDASGNAEGCAAPAGGGDVLGPATNTDNRIPQWNGANSKTLKDGYPVSATPATGTIPLPNAAGNLNDWISALARAGVNWQSLLPGDVNGGINWAGISALINSGNVNWPDITAIKPNVTFGTLGGVGTGLTGTASGLTAGNVTTNANLTGPVTSTGNATAIATGGIPSAGLNWPDINAAKKMTASGLNWDDLTMAAHIDSPNSLVAKDKVLLPPNHSGFTETLKSIWASASAAVNFTMYELGAVANWDVNWDNVSVIKNCTVNNLVQSVAGTNYYTTGQITTFNDSSIAPNSTIGLNFTGGAPTSFNFEIKKSRANS